MFPVTHTFWELRLGVVKIRGLAPHESEWVDPNISGNEFQWNIHVYQQNIFASFKL